MIKKKLFQVLVVVSVKAKHETKTTFPNNKEYSHLELCFDVGKGRKQNSLRQNTIQIKNQLSKTICLQTRHQVGSLNEYSTHIRV